MKFLLLCFALGLRFAAPLFAADEHPMIRLWPEGAPGSEARRNEPEKTNGRTASNIHDPSITVYLPAKGKETGCAVIVAPGGAHRNLEVLKEGHEIAEWFAAHGIAAFVLKNRLARDESNPAGQPQPYAVERHTIPDAQRAIQLVRSRAAEWAIDPQHVGIIGFSAGGEVALLTGTSGTPGRADSADPLERQSSRPDFFGLIYAAGFSRPNLNLAAETPPVFIACGYSDRFNLAIPSAEFFIRCKRAGVSAELHLYAGADHGFGIRSATNPAAATWIESFQAWLVDRKLIPARKS
jgi:endo-1,4-beta-xylanase